MDFTAYDKNSETWQKIKAHYEEKLVNLRKQNDHTMEENKRNILIGQISEVKKLLNIEHERASIPDASQGVI